MKECINKTNDFVVMSPRDQVSMIVKPETLDGFGKPFNYLKDLIECNVRCPICSIAFANKYCLSCFPGLFLLDGVCGTNCPEF